jgi:mannose-6-phosphate isomerase-like protein (cupin superfamily)
MKQTLVIWLAVAGVMAAAEPPGYVRWPGAELKALSKKLGPKMSPQKLAMEQLGRFGNHSLMAVHREGDGEAEIHETQVDIFIVENGEANLVIGGQVVGGKITAPNEIRGPSIKGGQRVRLGPGDVVHIPAKTAHQVLVEAGKQFTYLIVKVDTP